MVSLSADICAAAKEPGRDSQAHSVPVMDRPWLGTLFSLAFWLSLAISGGLFALLVLSPKIVHLRDLDRTYRRQQFELVILQEQNHKLDQAVKSLRDDPRFLAELARVEFRAKGLGEENLPVEAPLRLPDPRVPQSAPAMPPVADRWDDPWLAHCAGNVTLRRALIALAASLCLLAFGWMHESAWVRRRPETGLFFKARRLWKGRYL